MRHETDCWTYSLNPSNLQAEPQSSGKWLVYGTPERIDEWFEIVDRMVRAGDVYQAKRSRHSPENPLRLLPDVICVYADNRTRTRTLEALLDCGIIPVQWKYDWETARDWGEGGALKELAESLIRRRRLSDEPTQESTAPTGQFP